MFTDIVNKQAFEITCRTETTARRVHHDIESHTAQQFNHIMAAVFSEAGNKSNYLQIDKIEIDLGDIWVDEFVNTETASRFKELLRQKIEGIQNAPPGYSHTIAGRNGTADLTAEIKSELELIRVFIATGDLPWWINKSNELSIDAIVNKLLRQHPEMFKKVLTENFDKPELLSRLYSQISKASFSLITEIMPEFSEPAFREKLAGESVGTEVSHLSADQQKIVRQIRKEHVRRSFEKRRHLLTAQLIKFYEYLFVNNLSVEGSALENLLVLFGMAGWIRTEQQNYFTSSRNKKQQALNAVNRLTIFEVEILAFELSACFDAANNVVYPNAVPNKTGSPELNSGEENNRSGSNAGILNDPITENVNVYNNKLEGNYFAPEKAIEEEKIIVINKPELAAAPAVPNYNEPLKTKLPSNATDETVASKNDLDTDADTAQGNDFAADKTVETTAENLLPRQSKTISFIIKKLRRPDKMFIQYLQALSKTQLKHLAAIFKKRTIEATEHKKMISHLLEHPFFLEYDILKVFASLALAKELPTGIKLNRQRKNKLAKDEQKPGFNSSQKTSSPDLLHVLKHLPARDFFVFKDVLSKNRFDTEAEKRVFKKVLLQLSQQEILFLKYLTELPAADLKKLQPLAAQTSLPAGEKAGKIGDQYYKEKEAQNTQIENAGLCLLAVYLPGFFRQLGYLENGKFKNKNFAVRAVYLLQYVVSGTSKRPEYLLQFNKILCSLEPLEIIADNIHLTKKEKQETDTLLVSVIQNWKALKRTSVKGFRESFLQRKGILSETASAWVLRVEKKGFDILLDSVPWSFNLLKLPWMKKTIRVEW